MRHSMENKRTPEEERWIREAALDHTLAETFPASDPPSTLPNPCDYDLLHEISDTQAEDQQTPARAKHGDDE